MTLVALNEKALEAQTIPGDRYVRFTHEHVTREVWDAWMRVIRPLPRCSPTQGPWIAGGAIRRLLLGTDLFSADIDYFSKDVQQHHLICSRLETMDAVMTHDTKDHKTYRVPADHDAARWLVQVVRSRFCQSLEKHLDEFDFRLCQTGWDGEAFLVSLGAYKDLLSKELNVTGVFHNPLGSLMRVVKYYRQGFVPTQACITALLDAGKDHFDESGTYNKTP